jgi:rhodanese-related sulfurtransferase
VSQDELVRRLDRGDVVIIDVRPVAEYLAGHIDGALSLPNDELAERLAELPPDLEVVAYCRGRYCRLAPEAVRLLQGHGYRARVFADGMPRWRRSDLPVAVGPARHHELLATQLPPAS